MCLTLGRSPAIHPSMSQTNENVSPEMVDDQKASGVINQWCGDGEADEYLRRADEEWMDG